MRICGWALLFNNHRLSFVHEDLRLGTLFQQPRALICPRGSAAGHSCSTTTGSHLSMEHTLGAEATGDDDRRQPTRRLVDGLQQPAADRPDSPQSRLLHPIEVNKSRHEFDEQADVPIQTDQPPCWPPTTGYLSKSGQLESCPLKSPRACDDFAWRSGTHKIHVVSHDEHSCKVSLDPVHTPRCTRIGGSDMFGPAHKDQVEVPDTVDALNGCLSPVTDDILCDTVVKLELSTDTPQTQTEDIDETTQLTLCGSTGQTQTEDIHERTQLTPCDSTRQTQIGAADEPSQMTACDSAGQCLHMSNFSDSPSVSLAVSQTFPQLSCHHSHHQENNNRCNTSHLLHHKENNDHCSKDNRVLACPKCLPSSSCVESTRTHSTDHTDIPACLGNGWITTDTSEENDPLLYNLPATTMQGKYRYHVFFSHCPQDREWVEHVVEHLECPPYNYLCAYTSLHDVTQHDGLQESAVCAAMLSDVNEHGSLQQSDLCIAMLSEHVVLVLSRQYVQVTWPSLEKSLGQLTRMSVHHQTVLGVLLEDCHIPESMGNLCFLDACAPDFLHTFTKRLQSNVSNGTILTVCRLRVHVGWHSYLLPLDGSCLETAPSLSAPGIGMEDTEFAEIISKVSGIVQASNMLPWILSAQPLALLLLALLLWLPAFIAILVIHVDDDSGIALPLRLTVFLFPLGLVAGGYLIKWRRSYWMTKVVRLLVQNCVEVNQAFYFQGRPLFVTAAQLQANIFSIYFVYFDASNCVRNVDLLLFTCMENDWEKLVKLIAFYTRDANYLSRMSLSERLTVMISAAYLVKLVKQMLPQPPQERHVPRLLCLCQFTEECISRFAHGFDRADVPGLAELFVRHMPGFVSGNAVRRVQEELFHANHGLVQ